MRPSERKHKDKKIKDYLKSQGINKVIYLQPEQNFDNDGDKIIVWNVKTNKGAWWVVESDITPMNLYTQEAFYFSADEAYSFHLGIVQRLDENYRKNFKHVIDEIPLDIDRIKSIKRRLSVAAQELNNAIEAEDFQSIGLVCRECLLEFGKELIKGNKEPIKGKEIKNGDFKNIANAFVDYYIPGPSNADLRNYSKKVADIAWSYSSQIVHSATKSLPDTKISILLVSTAISLIENLFLKHLGFDSDLFCDECKSRDYEILESEKEEELLFVCKVCDYKKFFKVKKQ